MFGWPEHYSDGFSRQWQKTAAVIGGRGRGSGSGSVQSVRQGYVRFSPHFYTTREESEALDRILEQIGL